jgi:hypothetical protein
MAMTPKKSVLSPTSAGLLAKCAPATRPRGHGPIAAASSHWQLFVFLLSPILVAARRWTNPLMFCTSYDRAKADNASLKEVNNLLLHKVR